MAKLRRTCIRCNCIVLLPTSTASIQDHHKCSPKRPASTEHQELEQPTKRARTDSATHKPDRKGTFPFLKLPGELRNAIYEYACAEVQTVRCTPHKRCVDLSTTDQDDGRQPALARTCRQLREEFLPLFYQLSTFKLSCLCSSKPARNWLDSIRDYHHHLREVHIVDRRIAGDNCECTYRLVTLGERSPVMISTNWQGRRLRGEMLEKRSNLRGKYWASKLAAYAWLLAGSYGMPTNAQLLGKFAEVMYGMQKHRGVDVSGLDWMDVGDC